MKGKGMTTRTVCLLLVLALGVGVWFGGGFSTNICVEVQVTDRWTTDQEGTTAASCLFSTPQRGKPSRFYPEVVKI